MTITPTSRTPLALVLTLFFQATTGAQSPALREGLAALNAGEADAAIALLEQAAATDPTPRLALLHLAQAHLSAWPDGDENEWPAHAAAAAAGPG